MEIWTDGACSPNPGTGGWGFVRSDGMRDCGGALETTNNRMEMQAVLEALRSCYGMHGEMVTIYSDSMYVVQGMNAWVRSWKRSGWKRKAGAIQNLDLWRHMDSLRSAGLYSFVWVKGHNGNQMNELADKLAADGMAKMHGKKTRIVQKDFTREVRESYGRLCESGRIDPLCDEMADLEAAIAALPVMRG